MEGDLRMDDNEGFPVDDVDFVDFVDFVDLLLSVSIKEFSSYELVCFCVFRRATERLR